MKKLHLNLKREYFEQIKSGEKQEEFRLCTTYWCKRLIDCDYDIIVLKSGYPKAGDASRTIERPYQGWKIKSITHPHFGPDAVDVFAINVSA